MIRYFSIRMKLDDIIVDRDFEQKVMENLRYARKITGKQFRVIFWNENLTEKQCKDFVKRNEKMLFEIRTQITSINSPFDNCWFLIDSDNSDNCKKRYSYKGDILNGIAEYIKIVKLIKRKENENSYNR